MNMATGRKERRYYSLTNILTPLSGYFGSRAAFSSSLQMQSITDHSKPLLKYVILNTAEEILHPSAVLKTKRIIDEKQYYQ